MSAAKSETEEQGPDTNRSESHSQPSNAHDTQRDAIAPEAPKEDTLLSAPAPAEGVIARDPRVGDLERQLDQLNARVRVLEMSNPKRPFAPFWLTWVVFLLALLVIWLGFFTRTR